ncbi:MAG: hypothetical protein CME71_07270 [Halobacteriovorax sp.]|nr:hypothetical protein [Halobacteriovorax sp.]|tara:strand:- start:1293 stop:1829 length:537 start_codon:yes stop_codon:yes gene_type:complete
MNNIETINKLSSKWIEQLALEEINMDESGIIHMDDHLNPHALLEESSIDFMNTVRDRFEFYINRFNQYRGGANAGALIKTFKISNTVNDFMMFRNSLRMIFARRAHDVISIGFLSNGKDLFAPRLSDSDTYGQQIGTHEVRAHVGPFNQITWRFQGEAVDVDALVRHYLSEFIRQSAR